MAIKSQKVVVAAGSGGAVQATTSDATWLDALTTAISTDTAVTGMVGLAQRGALFVGGMAVQNKIKNGSFNFLK